MRKKFAPLVIVLSLLMPACASLLTGGLEAPNVTLVDIRPKSMTMFDQQYDLSLRVQNTNDKDLALSGLNFALKLNDDEFARGVSRNKVTIPALSDALVHVTVSSSTLDWLQQIQKLDQKKQQGFTYELTGTLYLDSPAGRLPFSRSGKIDSLK